MVVSAGEQRLTLVSRSEWGAQPSPGPQPPTIQHPVDCIRYSYTITEPCLTSEECVAAVQQYQKKYIDWEYYDQPYNFLIGGDGVVYEGRGWDLEANRPRRYKKLKGKCIDVAYIGDYATTFPDVTMQTAAAALAQFGIKNNKIKENPRILSLHDFREQFE